MPPKQKIAILTGGGDVPGLNPVIKSVVYRASELGRSVIGIRKGVLTVIKPMPNTPMAWRARPISAMTSPFSRPRNLP